MRGCVDGWMERCPDGQVVRQRDRYMSGWMDRWMDRDIGGQIDGWMHVFIYLSKPMVDYNFGLVDYNIFSTLPPIYQSPL